MIRKISDKKASADLAIGTPIKVILVVVTIILVLMFLFRVPLSRWLDIIIPDFGPSDESDSGSLGGDVSVPDAGVSNETLFLIGKISNEGAILLFSSPWTSSNLLDTNLHYNDGKVFSKTVLSKNVGGNQIATLNEGVFSVREDFFNQSSEFFTNFMASSLDQGVNFNNAINEIKRIHNSNLDSSDLRKTYGEIEQESKLVTGDWQVETQRLVVDERKTSSWYSLKKWETCYLFQVSDNNLYLYNADNRFILIYDKDSNIEGIIYADGSLWLERSAIDLSKKNNFNLMPDLALGYHIELSEEARLLEASHEEDICNLDGAKLPLAGTNAVFCETNLRISTGLFKTLLDEAYTF